MTAASSISTRGSNERGSEASDATEEQRLTTVSASGCGGRVFSVVTPPSSPPAFEDEEDEITSCGERVTQASEATRAATGSQEEEEIDEDDEQ